MNRKLGTAAKRLAILTAALTLMALAYFHTAGAAVPQGVHSAKPSPSAGFLPAVFGEHAGLPTTPTPVPTDTSEPPTPEATATSTATSTATGTPTSTPTATPSPTATVKPTKTPTPTPTVKPSQTPQPGDEMLVYDWNQPVTIQDHGFPWDKPPLANGDWTQPTNYAQGTLYLRAQIRSQPVPQKDMKLQFCIWQYGSDLETCTAPVTVPGTSGTVVTWSQAIDKMWKKDSLPLVWSEPRDRNGVSVKNAKGDPVSDYSGWNWAGEDPNDWYPLDMRFTVVVVEKGASFSGWDNYIP